MRRVVAVLAAVAVSVLAWYAWTSTHALRTEPAHVDNEHVGPIDDGSAATQAVYERESKRSPSTASPVRNGTRVEAVLSIEVVDVEGKALSDVELTAAWLDGTAAIGRTDFDGHFERAIERRPELVVRGVYRGRFSGSVAVPEDAAAVSIRIDTGGKIRGIVRFADGSPAPSGVHVISWPTTTSEVPTRIAARALSGDDSVPHTRTDERGRFELLGLDTLARYNVTAAGRGLMRKQPVTGVVPGGPEVPIEIARAFAVVVELRDGRTREPVRVPPSYWPLGAVTCRLDDPSVQHFPPGSPESVLAGMDPALHLPAEAYWRHISLCASAESTEMIGPFAFHAELPGYAPVDASLFAKPLAGGVHTETLFVEPTSGTWGRLRLVLDGELAGGRFPIDAQLPCGFVNLSSQAGETIRYAIATLAESDVFIDPVPSGAYDAVVSLHNGMTRFPATGAIPISVDDGTATITWSVDPLGGIELQIVERDGSVFDGAIALTLGKRPRGGHPIGFLRPPYLLQGLEPGEYEVRLVKPFMSRLVPPAQGEPVTVHAGDVSTLRFVRE